MAKIMAVNAGSSSIKFQLLEMPQEEVITSGIMEKIGTTINGENVPGIFTIKYNGKKDETNPVLVDHAVGVELLLKALVEKGIVKSLDEITGVGHRVVQGGEFFNDSCLVDEEVIQKISDLSALAPLHNPAHVVGIRAFQKAQKSSRTKSRAIFTILFFVFFYCFRYLLSWYSCSSLFFSSSFISS